MDWDLQLWFLGGATLAQLVGISHRIEASDFQDRHKHIAFWLVRLSIAILLSFAYVASTFKNPLAAFFVGASAIPFVRLADRAIRLSINHHKTASSSNVAILECNDRLEEEHGSEARDEAA